MSDKESALRVSNKTAARRLLSAFGRWMSDEGLPTIMDVLPQITMGLSRGMATSAFLGLASAMGFLVAGRTVGGAFPVVWAPLLTAVCLMGGFCGFVGLHGRPRKGFRVVHGAGFGRFVSRGSENGSRVDAALMSFWNKRGRRAVSAGFYALLVCAAGSFATAFALGWLGSSARFFLGAGDRELFAEVGLVFSWGLGALCFFGMDGSFSLLETNDDAMKRGPALALGKVVSKPQAGSAAGTAGSGWWSGRSKRRRLGASAVKAVYLGLSIPARLASGASKARWGSAIVMMWTLGSSAFLLAWLTVPERLSGFGPGWGGAVLQALAFAAAYGVWLAVFWPGDASDSARADHGLFGGFLWLALFVFGALSWAALVGGQKRVPEELLGVVLGVRVDAASAWWRAGWFVFSGFAAGAWALVCVLAVIFVSDAKRLVSEGWRKAKEPEAGGDLAGAERMELEDAVGGRSSPKSKGGSSL